MRNINSSAYKNDICQACIKKQFEKYGKFACDCSGITVEQDVKFAIKNGMTEEDARWLYDPVYFFGLVYGKPARKYQKKLLYCSSKKLAARQCRQTGKTLIIMFKIFHHIITNENATVLVVAPQEAQIKKIWDEYIFRDFIYKSDIIKSSMTGKSMSPTYNVQFDNGSKIILMIAGPGVRGQTCDWLYIDEAAIVQKEILNDIIMVMASRGDDATIIETSTPKGRGNPFYEACKESPEFAEFHTSIYDVEEMAGQIEFFKKLLGETGFKQEAEAEFPDVSGGPFNHKGIDLAKSEYEYEFCAREPGYLYFGGVDWNGPNIGTYFYIIGFNPDINHIKCVDKQVVSSAVWNSTVAKQTFIELNRKWQPKHWMVDYGYSHSICEDLKLWSLKSEQDGMIEPMHPDAMIKHILEPVQFGSWTEIEDPFNREITKKTTRGFIIGQVSRLFEPENNLVPISYPASDVDLIASLENYKMLNITGKGTEQYGFEKNSGFEDHLIDAFCLALYGIIKHYSELFKRIIAESVRINARELLSPNMEMDTINIHHSQSIVLLTDNSPQPITLDENKIKKYEPKEEELVPVVSRTFNRGMERRPPINASRRNNYVITRILPI